jgi:sporulation protein YlmC with PRC-barrel domain
MQGVPTEPGAATRPQRSAECPVDPDELCHTTEDLIGSVVKDQAGKGLARVDHLVLDLDFGNIFYVVLRSDRIGDFGDKLIPVPWDRFSLVGSDELMLNSDRAKLTQAPGFALNDWGRLFADPRWNRGVATYWGSTTMVSRIDKAPPSLGGMILVRAEEMRGWPVIGRSGEAISTVRRILLNLHTGTIATVLVTQPGSPGLLGLRIPIPYQKFTVSKKEALALDVDWETLARAPVVDESGWGSPIKDFAWNRNIYRYWGVSYPSSVASASAGGSSQTGTAKRAPMGQNGQ